MATVQRLELENVQFSIFWQSSLQMIAFKEEEVKSYIAVAYFITCYPKTAIFP